MEAIAGAFFNATGIYTARKVESEWHKEGAMLPASIQQVTLALIVLNQISLYFKLQEKNKSLSTPKILLGALTPLFISGIEYSTPNRVTRLVTYQLGFLLTAAYFITTCAILKLKKHSYVASSLSGYIIVAIVDQERVPENLRSGVMNVITVCDRLHTLIFETSLFFRGVALLQCFTYGERLYSPLLFGKNHRNINPKHFKNIDYQKPQEGKSQAAILVQQKPKAQTEKEALNHLLYEKQEEFLAKVFEEDYQGQPEWYRKLFGEGTPQQKLNYRLFYGQPIGLDDRLAQKDPVQNLDGMGLSRLIWISYVRHYYKQFYDEFYTEKNLVTWVVNSQTPFLKIIDTEEKARQFLIDSEVLTRSEGNA